MFYVPWVKHFQSAWDNRAANTDLPLWARIVCLAYGRHEANGHANFHRGELSVILGKQPANGDDFKRRDRHTVRDAIATAVKYGFLAEGSCTECLLVPRDAVSGPLGNPHSNAQCMSASKNRRRARLSR